MPAREPLSKEQIAKALEDLEGWDFEDDQLVTSYEFDDFRAAVAFIVRVGFEAEELNHHPEIFNVYNTVDLGLNTHDAGGKVTEMDVALAKKIEAL